MWTLQDAKNKFSAVVAQAVAGHPQQVSRRGELAVVVVAIDDYRRLQEAATQNRKGFAEHLLDFPDVEIGRMSASPRDISF